MSDAYAYKPGSLKLKKDKDKDGKKKKSSASKSLQDVPKASTSTLKGDSKEGSESDTPKDAANTAAPTAKPDRYAGMTESEKRFAIKRDERLAKRVAKQAKTSHKDRVAEFNAKLEALSEHHDLPKIGPG